MALIVETGSGLSNSESYCSVSFADSYFNSKANLSWSTLSTSQKEAALREATSFLTERYRNSWKGLRVYSAQALDWPRSGVRTDSFVDVPTFSVPVEVQKACAELALKASSSELTPDVTRVAIRQKVGELEVEYDKQAQNQPAAQFLKVRNMLAPLLVSGSNGSSIRLVRV